jgi:cob(I)alamin adenosyltransferase
MANDMDDQSGSDATIGTDGLTSHEVPIEDPRPVQLRQAPSLVVVNTGNGKGKSSSAVGVIVRSVARGWPVAVIQFLKSGSWNTGEEKVGRDLGVDWWAMGEGFTWDSENLSEDEAVAGVAWQHARSVIEAGAHRLVVLDEITYPMNWGWIDTDEVVRTIAGRPANVNVVCTGRDAPGALIDVADTVTEMVEVKHAYQQGIRAKKGIDY